jgi:PAS domain S-box-containing protein
MLRESELFYRNLIADSIDGILLNDEQGLISFASPSIKKILGYEPEEPVGKILFEYGHPDDLELGMSTFRDELAHQPQVKFISIRLKKKSGEWLWCIVRGHNLLDNPYVGKMVIYFSDDTRRKNAEEALLLSEERSRYRLNILNNVTDLIVTTDMDRKISSWNKVAEKLTGVEAKQALGKKTSDVIDVSYYPYTNDQVAEIVMQEGIWRGEIHFTGADGTRRHLLHTVSLFSDDKGEKMGFLGVGKDITERMEAEKRLQQSEVFYRSLISYSLDGIVITDEAGKVSYCAPSVNKMIGYNPEQVLGRSVFDFIHPDDEGKARQAFQLELQKASIDDYVSLRLKKAGGEWNWYAVRAHNLLSNPVLNGFIIYFTDDSGRRASAERVQEKQRQLTQATIDGQEKERLEIGKELHDNINQHLTTTRLYLEVAHEKAQGDVQEMIRLSHKTLVGIIDEIRRMSQSLIPPTLGDLGLVESISDLCDALRRAHTFQVEFYNRHFSEENLPSNVKLMLFRIIQEQISNIIRHSAASRIQIKLQSDAEYLILTVSDNGKGFDRENVKKGLGFTNILNRAGLFNGTMEVETAPGKGCTLTVIFPVTVYYAAPAS